MGRIPICSRSRCSISVLRSTAYSRRATKRGRRSCRFFPNFIGKHDAKLSREIRLFAGDYAPDQWLLCQGQLLSISTYQALYSLLGTTYGGDGVSTFALPDLRGRVPVGQGQARA
ncbi:phage tail protein [Methylogaea oryzae]|uniref:phage tail protein n=1 Tax=Methylogaea oryzae TaxID=1295382 RepID=UPI00357172A6